MPDREAPDESDLDNGAANLRGIHSSNAKAVNADTPQNSEERPRVPQEMHRAPPDYTDETGDSQNVLWRLRAAVWDWFRR